MDKLVRKIEIPLAKKAIEKAGLYIVQKKDLARLAEVAADAYQDYPLHNWFTKGKYDEKASKLIMQISGFHHALKIKAIFQGMLTSKYGCSIKLQDFLLPLCIIANCGRAGPASSVFSALIRFACIRNGLRKGDLLRGDDFILENIGMA